MKIKSWWYTIIELIVAIVIFTIWWLSAFLLVYSSITSSILSKNEIITANIAREKIELIQNLRDSNWLQFRNWDKLNNAWLPEQTLTWWYYIIENDFGSSESSPKIKIKKLSSSFNENYTYLRNPTNSEDRTNICINSSGKYAQIDCDSEDTKTPFYAFVKIEPLYTEDENWNRIEVKDAFKIYSKIADTQKRFKLYSYNTIITNWKK